MNILIVCDYFLDYLGGAQTAIAAQANALREAGHRVTVVAPRRTRVPSADEEHSLFSPVVLPGLDMAVVANTAATRARIGKWIDELSIDVVHVHSEFGLAVAALESAAAAGVPTVQTVHTFYWRSGAPSLRPVGWLLRVLYHRATGLVTPHVRLSHNAVDDAIRSMTLAVALRADTVVSPSAHQATDLRAAGARDVRTVANCVSAGSGAEVHPVETVSGALRVFWVGRCIADKRVLEFTEAAALACETVGAGRLEVTIAGAGPLLAGVRRAAERTPGVRVLGQIGNSAVAALLASHHASALTSFGYDNQPMTVAESVSALRGVIYVDPRLREGLDEAGILVGDRSVKGMAAALIELALDPRPVIEASGRAIAARTVFASGTHAAAIVAIYRSQQDRRAAVRAKSAAMHAKAA